MSSSAVPVPSDRLRAGRRALDDLPEVTILTDWVWQSGPGLPESLWPAGAWVLHCVLAVDVLPEGPIPAGTAWYVCVDPNYPWGRIKFYPAKQGGITQTFAHQDYNGVGHPDVPWHSGAPCLDMTVRVLGLHGGDAEPMDQHRRLWWHFRRAIGWLELASRGGLVVLGDWFELPHFPQAAGDLRVVFSEGPESLAAWQGIGERAGFVDFSLILRGTGLLVVKGFRSLSGRSLVIPTWGRWLAGVSLDSRRGVWLRLDRVPVLDPWQVPATWEELRRAWYQQGLTINGLLQPIAGALRDGKRHIALIGFPIPARVGAPPSVMQWQAVQLPLLTHRDETVSRRGRHTRRGRWYVPPDPATADGFRPGEKGAWHRDRLEVFNGSTDVEWVMSENWHAEQLATRGRFPDPLRSARILLIGAGAIGSVVGELLVRAGVQKLKVMDADRFEAGNLVRHTLTLEDVGVAKAAALARRLNLLSPHATVEAIEAPFPPLAEEARRQVQECAVIINCTAEYEVLHDLAMFPWEQPRLFVSLSVGRSSTRLFCFTAYGDTFPEQTFMDLLTPWAGVPVPPTNTAAGADGADEELPWAGIGCWHPVFPARADDITLMAAIAVKRIQDVIARGQTEPELAVFEQQREEGLFSGVQRVEGPTTCA